MVSIWEVRGLDATRTRREPLVKREDKARVDCGEDPRPSKSEHRVMITSAPPRELIVLWGLSGREVRVLRDS